MELSKSNPSSCAQKTRWHIFIEPFALTALEINRALGITDNIPESSFGTVNNKLIAAGKRDNDLRAVAREASWPQVPNPGWMPKSKRAAVHLQHVRAVARQTVGKRHGHRSPIPAGYRNRNGDEREQHQDRDGRMQLTTRRKS